MISEQPWMTIQIRFERDQSLYNCKRQSVNYVYVHNIGANWM